MQNAIDPLKDEIEASRPEPLPVEIAAELADKLSSVAGERLGHAGRLGEGAPDGHHFRLHQRPDRFGDHASYIARWLKVLKDDKRAIFTAGAYAERACGFLHQRQPLAAAEAEEAEAA